MSTILGRFLTTGLSLAASFFGLAMGVCAGSDGPAVPVSPPSHGAPANQESFLLLTDGRLIEGIVAREGSTYLVTDPKFGVIRFPERRVEGLFHSIRDAYEYQREQLPENDPGERMKLVHWCLTLDMTAEAKEQLRKVLELSPDHAPAKAMLAHISQSEAVAARRKRDPQVQQTGAEAAAEDRPGALDAAVLRAQRGMGVPGLPVIFDLPRPLAIRRAEEFANYIHPVLQAYCARCHDGEHGGEFQLVPVRSRRQQTPDALRANLDATLRLVDPSHPSRSELLSSTLRPHHGGPSKPPIFPGSNDRAYQILAAWVNSLRTPQSGTAAPRRSPDQSPSDSDEVFAAHRGRSGRRDGDIDSPGVAPGSPRAAATPVAPTDPRFGPSFRYVPGQGMVREDPRWVDPGEFPLPSLLGGLKPAGLKGLVPRGVVNRTARPPHKGTSSEVLPPLPGVEAIGPSEGARGAGSGATPQLSPTESTSSAQTGTGKKTTQPLKLDPALLERMLNARRGGGGGVGSPSSGGP